MATSAILGYPRLGVRRELKRGLEKYWAGKISVQELEAVGTDLRRTHWQLQQRAGIDHIPSNDFSYYDQVLDTTAMVGAVPARYGWQGDKVDLDTYFSMARGRQDLSDKSGPAGAVAMEMTKWFDTNYHYLVPEFVPDQEFRLASTKAVDEFLEAKALGIHTRPVLLGPVTYLLLGKSQDADLEPLDLLPRILPVYAEVLAQLADAGAEWVQMDEPALVLDLDEQAHAAYRTAYQALSQSSRPKVMLTPYFGDLRDNLETVRQLPVDGLHVDAVRGAGQLYEVVSTLPAGWALSLGLVDGRNVWRTDLAATLRLAQEALGHVDSARLQIAPSCSLLFVPHDLAMETSLDEELQSWLAFAEQKLDEVVALQQALDHGGERVDEAFEANQAALNSRRSSTRIQNPVVRKRMAELTPTLYRRNSPYPIRREAQQQSLNLPVLPTTTIGSFPQTPGMRAARSSYRKGQLTIDDYEDLIRQQIHQAVEWQEAWGLDVLVHGEFERTDMVEYFGEQMTGLAFTTQGWVQSYGSRAVRPPVIYGDVARPAPMTLRWAAYAQSLSSRPVKGMLTGPVTILEWSFVRDDQPRADTCRQLALAIRDEVMDLEAAGIGVIQVDEPALREGLPLRHADWDPYLEWATECFQLATAGVRDATQIHTHMCYAEFNDIIDAIVKLDADVISIESSRSQMDLLGAFVDHRYPNDIGPGIYDIHSPRTPNSNEMAALLEKALGVLEPEQLWVNPDCGLKTRRWEEVTPTLKAMVAAAHEVRARIESASGQVYA